MILNISVSLTWHTFHTQSVYFGYQVNIKQNGKQGILLRRNNFENVNRFKEKNDYYFKCLINQEL